MFIEIIHFGIVLLAGTISLNYNFLFKMITLDSLFGALHFMGRFIDNNLTESQIVTETNSLYSGTTLDRYIYYTMLYLFYKTAFYFFWINESFIYYYIGLITIIPFIINRILQSRLFEIIRQKKEIFVKTILAKIITNIIKFCAKVYLDKEVNVKYTEIMEILKDYMETVNYFFTVLKSLAVILGLSYVKSYAPSLYYGIIKYIYNYKTGELLTSYNHDSAKYLISDIIENKKWYELTKANTFKAILYLYQMNTDKVDFFGKLIHEFNFTLIKMFSIWTIASLISNIYVSPILALCLLLYKRFMRKSNDDTLYNLLGELALIIVSAIVGYFNESYFLVSFINQFGSKLLFNSVTFIIIRVLCKNMKEIGIDIFKNNKDTTVSYIIINGYILFLRFINTDAYILIGLNILANVLMGVETKKQIIFGIILVTTFLSNFAFTHVIFNSIILYFIFGLFDFWSTYTIQDLLKIFLDFVGNMRTDINLNINWRTKKNKYAFKLLDTEKYPSISQLGQEIKKHEASSIRDSVSIDDPIFDQPHDVFMNEISVDDSQSAFYVKSVTSSEISIIDNFLP